MHSRSQLLRRVQVTGLLAVCTVSAIFAACSDTPVTKVPADPIKDPASDIVHRSDIKPVTRVEDAKPGVFIPPFLDCRDPLAGDPAGTSKDGKVCTNVAISGATEAGKAFAKYASCDIVRAQRPYYPTPPAKVPSASDPRLADAKFMTEVNWAKGERVRLLIVGGS
jgi:hypothetical protein